MTHLKNAMLESQQTENRMETNGAIIRRLIEHTGTKYLVSLQSFPCVLCPSHELPPVPRDLWDCKYAPMHAVF